MKLSILAGDPLPPVIFNGITSKTDPFGGIRSISPLIFSMA